MHLYVLISNSLCPATNSILKDLFVDLNANALCLFPSDHTMHNALYMCVCVRARLSGHESYKPMNTWRCCVCVFKLIARGLLLTKMDIMNISKCHWIGNSSGLEVHSHILKFTKSLFFNCWKTLPKVQQLMYGTTMETTSHLTFFCVLYFWCV